MNQFLHEIGLIDKKLEEVKVLMLKKPSKIKQYNDLIRQRIHLQGRVGLLTPGNHFHVVKVWTNGNTESVLAYGSESEAEDAFRLCLSGSYNRYADSSDYQYILRNTNA